MPTEPRTIRPGTSVSWNRSVGEYSPTNGWSLRYTFINSRARFEVDASTAGNQWVAAISTVDSAAYSPGKYTWIATVTRDSEVIEVDRGQIEVTAPLSAPVDGRTDNERFLDAIEAVLGGRASQDQLSMTVGERSLERIPLSDLLRLRSHYKTLVDQEQGRGTQLTQVRFS